MELKELVHKGQHVSDAVEPERGKSEDVYLAFLIKRKNKIKAENVCVDQ